MDDAAVPSPSLRSWWIEGVRVLEKPHLLTVWDGAELLGGLALSESRRGPLRVLRPAGWQLGADHVGVVARPDARMSVARALHRYFGRECQAALILPSVDCTAHTLAALPEALRVQTDDVIPYIDLSDGYDEWFGRLRKKFRTKSIEQVQRRLAREDRCFRTLDRPDLPRALAALREMHVARFGTESALVPYWREFDAVVRAAWDAGEVVIGAICGKDGTLGTVNVGFRVGSRLSIYATGRRPDGWPGAGVVTMAEMVRWAAGAGLSEVDLLRGAEPYKLELATGVRGLVTIRSASGVSGRAYQLARRASQLDLRWRR